MKSYKINKIDDSYELSNNFADKIWDLANVGLINEVREESSEHHPEVAFKLLYNKSGFFIKYDVKDRYIRTVNHNFQDPVCQDSCVEFFVASSSEYYINFEINAIGTLFVSRVYDWHRDPITREIAKLKLLEAEEAKDIKIFHNLKPQAVEHDGDWSIMAFIPFSLFELNSEVNSGDIWRGNFYKCADLSSHPHWISYNKVNQLNFHLPECFGDLIFA